jgi:hypothetical protein
MKKIEVQKHLPKISRKEETRQIQVCKWPEEMPDMPDIHRVGWTVVPMLWIHAANRTQKQDIQRET